MNKIHFLYVPMTGLGLYKGYRGDHWLKNRLRVFKEFTVPALMNQQVKEFIVWMSWRKEEKDNPIVQETIKSLDQLRGMRFVHTFAGCCFYDDKYPDHIAKVRLKGSLLGSLPTLKEYIPEDTDYVLVTIQPSDDMFLSHAVKDIQSQEYQENKAIGYTAGYIMRYDTLEISEYNPKTIPPFFTIMFPPEVFIDPKKHFEYIGPYESHEYIKDKLNFTPLEGRGFIVGTHGENISTGYNHSFRGRVLNEQENESIRIQSGTLFAKPLILVKDMKRKVMKKVLNSLPHFIQYLIVQWKSPGVTSQIKNYKWFNL